MENRNPYASPSTQVADAAVTGDYGEVRIFSTQGRLGRVRYLGYSIGLTLLFSLILGLVVGILTAAIGAADPSSAAGVATAAGGLSYIVLFAVQIVLATRRAHDFNSSGWLSLLVLVPLVNLIFLFIPGTRGENRFGKPPPPNTVGVIILACLLPLIAVVGILAAIAIPAYQDYTIRAQVSEGLNLAAAPKAAVAEVFIRDGAAPADRESAGLPAAATASGGRYTASVEIVRGTLLVTYGGMANAQIAGKTLAMQPYLTPDKKVVWQCGKAARPPGAAPIDSAAPSAGSATDIAPRFLPSACRP